MLPDCIPGTHKILPVPNPGSKDAAPCSLLPGLQSPVQLPHATHTLRHSRVLAWSQSGNRFRRVKSELQELGSSLRLVSALRRFNHYLLDSGPVDEIVPFVQWGTAGHD